MRFAASPLLRAGYRHAAWVASVLTVGASVASAQTYRLAPSGRATTEISITLADTAAQRAAGAPKIMRVDYGQPHLRGRTLHQGDLVPYGAAWRVGANAATVFTTDVDLNIAGGALPKGRYVLYALPEPDKWTLIFQQETTGAASVAATQYSATKDFLRVPLMKLANDDPVESLSIVLVPDVSAPQARGALHILWEKVMLVAPWEIR